MKKRFNEDELKCLLDKVKDNYDHNTMKKSLIYIFLILMIEIHFKRRSFHSLRIYDKKISFYGWLKNLTSTMNLATKFLHLILNLWRFFTLTKSKSLVIFKWSCRWNFTFSIKECWKTSWWKTFNWGQNIYHGCFFR